MQFRTIIQGGPSEWTDGLRWKRTVAWAFREAVDGRAGEFPHGGPVSVRMEFVCEDPDPQDLQALSTITVVALRRLAWKAGAQIRKLVVEKRTPDHAETPHMLLVIDQE